MRIGIVAIAFLVIAGLAAQSADAHTVARGWRVVGGNLEIWTGSYHTTGQSPATQGSASIAGVGSSAFTLTSSGAPSGLSGFESGWASAVSSWQGAVFTNLDAGLHSIDISGQSSAKWAKLGAGGGSNTGVNWPWRTQLPSVPEPVTLTLLGSALAMGIAFRRRRKA